MGQFLGMQNEKLIIKWLLWLGGLSLIFYPTALIVYINSYHFLFFKFSRVIGIIMIGFAILVHNTWDGVGFKIRFLKWFLSLTGLTLLFFDTKFLNWLDSFGNFYFLKPSTYLGFGMILYAIWIHRKCK